jgi:hypothetical protein
MAGTHPADTCYVGDDWILTRTLDPASLASSPIDVILSWALATRGGLNQIVGPSAVDVEVVDAATGVIAIHVSRTVTQEIAPGRYYDAVRMFDPVAGLDTVMVGDVHVLQTGFTAEPLPPPDLGSPGESPGAPSMIGDYLSASNPTASMPLSASGATVVLAQLDIPPGDWDVSTTVVVSSVSGQSTIGLNLMLSLNPNEWFPDPGYGVSITGITLSGSDYRTVVMGSSRFVNATAGPVTVYCNVQYTTTQNLNANVFMRSRRWD